MQLLQYLAVLTQVLPGYEYVKNITTPPTPTPTTTSSELHTTTDPQIETRTAVYTMTDQSKKFTLPPLPYAYDALEPYISKQIMELHHTKHHQAYVNNLNAALENQVTALKKNDVRYQIELQQSIKFNGGGHINHSLFWTNLCPADLPAASPLAAPKLKEAIERQWGSFDAFRETFNKTLLGIQGSGWGWLAKDRHKGYLSIKITKDQDPVVGDNVPIFGVDMWEHAYYLQYYNDKGSYVKGIWNVINWETAESRFKETAGLSALKL